MARTFSKNTSNYCSLGTGTLNPLLSGASAISVACFGKAASVPSGTNVNRLVCVIVNSNSSGIALMCSGTPNKVDLGVRSQTGDTFNKVTGATSISTGVWTHFGAVANFAGNSMTAYYNGASDGTASPTFAASSYTPGTPTVPDYIGAFGNPTPADTSLQFDGDIAELGIWKVALTAAEFAALAAGVPPSRIRPLSLVAYYPLNSDGSTVPNRVSSTGAGTVTGSIPYASHAPVAPWFGCSSDWVPYSASGAITYYLWNSETEENFNVLTY